ncbi:hypothetical protein PR202_gb24229 [Eleusine coracana subsp. coracana]|uniref:Protein kinase domain-containing protein n=1 Tax=Eleusine coracana subsp. coracana TaxID=191504 RepID=A0AAV5FKY2_ELECO|nr:hypothetical protein PR202_gb24229 [Eleusine coracana subsp. coracana]
MPVATFLPPPDAFDYRSSAATGASGSDGGSSTGTLFIDDHNPIGGLQIDPEEHARDLLESMLLDTRVEPTDMPLSLLKSITNNFSNDRQIGVGGFAVVYKGKLQNGAVAVKKLTKTLDVHETKFHQEVDSLLRVKHKNIVRFLGYCSVTQGKVWKLEGRNVMAEERQRFLCFEYLPEGSLDNYISGKYFYILFVRKRNEKLCI